MWRKRLALFCGSVILSLIVAEGLTRTLFQLPVSIQPPEIIDTELGPIPVPYQHGRITVQGIADYIYTNNSLGLRGSAEYGPKTKPRILLLGDSYTYGMGVNDDETFAALLQKLLPNYEVINGGCPNQGTDYALKFFRLRGAGFRPDVVILSFYGGNDFADNQRGWYFDQQLNPVILPVSARVRDWRTHPIRSWLIDHIRLIYLSRAIAVHYRSPTSLNVDLTARYLTILRDEVEATGAQFFIVYIPEGGFLNGSRQENAFRQIVNTNHISAQFLTSLRQSDYLKEGHLGPHGHEVIANTISAFYARSHFR